MNAYKKSALSIVSMASIVAIMAGCNGGSDSTSASPITGVFIDAAVEGLEYVAGTNAKIQTNAKGEFSCVPGESVAFSVGGVAFGAATCSAVITPLSLAGSNDTKDIRVVNRLLALQLFDEDNGPANGIKIAADVRAALNGRTLDFSAPAEVFNAALIATLQGLPAQYRSRSVDSDRRMLVREHFENTLSSGVTAAVTETVTQTQTQTNGLGTVSATVTRYQIQAANNFYVPYEGTNSAIKAEFPNGFLPSYGSGLAFKGTAANGDLEFYGLTDRGPNGDGPNVPALSTTGTSGAKIFPSPGFAPSIGVITVGKNGAILSSSTPIKIGAGTNVTGLPLPEGTPGNSAEVPVFEALRYDAASKATFSVNGLDPEAIAVDKKRNVLWVSDEYGPFILKIDPANGVITRKFAPGSGLPTIFAKRRANRGMEGMALDGVQDKLHGFLQSPLSDGSAFYAVTNSQQRVERFARFTRWIEFDPVSETTTRMFAYPIAGSDYQDGRTGNAKLGDVVALGNGKFIVIEQGASPSGAVFNKLMLVEIGNATDIGAAGFNPSTSDLEKSSMGAVAVNGANWANVVTLKKTVLFDLNAAGWLAEKAEGLTIVDANTLALANDNDFGLKTNVYDAAGGVVSGADVTACIVNAAGVIISSTSTGCNAANSARVARGLDKERPSRLWLIKFSTPLVNFSVPAGS